MKRLFDENDRYTLDGLDLRDYIFEDIIKMFKEYTAIGYNIHDIRYLIEIFFETNRYKDMVATND